jgi:hypothetical protein
MSRPSRATHTPCYNKSAMNNNWEDSEWFQNWINLANHRHSGDSRS